MKKLIYILIMWTTCSCFSQDDPNLKKLLAELDAAPPWGHMTEKDVETQGKKLMAVISKFKELNEQEARAFVQKFLSRKVEDWRLLNEQYPHDAQMDAWGKIYVFNRYYFEVPEKEEKMKCHFFGGWMIPNDIDSNYFRILYPLVEGPSKKLCLTGPGVGFLGPEYRGLDEFDYFLKKYRRRFPEKDH